MKVDSLERYERPACAICGVMAPEVQLPVGDGCKPACWLCAHDATEHADGSKCTCSASEIYPAHVIAKRSAVVVSAPAPRRFTTVSTSYKPDGTRDHDGPKLVTEFEEIAPGVLRAMGLTLRPMTRGERISRTFRQRNRVVTK